MRSYDRGHTLHLVNVGVDYEIRETFESALAFGAAALRQLGVPDEDVAELMAGVRERDAERLRVQQVEGIFGGRGILRTEPTPTPLTPPRRGSQPLSEETAVVAMDSEKTKDVESPDQ